VNRTVLRTAILALFFLSGACTLVYEIAWVRMFVLVFGTSVYAVSTVLSAFMAGLALGSALFGRVADRRGNALRLYAWLELGIGLFALAFPFILSRLDSLYTVLYGWLQGSPAAFAAARFALSFLVLLVPATLMGATLPVLSRFAVRGLGRLGRGVGLLYALNTFGAVTGCALTAFVLLEQLGVRGSTTLAALVNIAIAAVAFLLARRVDGGEADARAAGGTKSRRRPAPSANEPSAIPPLAARAVFWGFALSGFAALGYEVAWTRLLGVVLRLTTNQSLSTILITFLFGLAVGGAIGARYADLGAATLRAWRRRGICAAATALVCRGLQARGLVPVWSTGEGNEASQAVARRVGFSRVGTTRYVIRAGDGPTLGF